MIREYDDIILVEDINGKMCTIPKKEKYTLDDFRKELPIAGFAEPVRCLLVFKDFIDKKGAPVLGRTPEYLKSFLDAI